MTIKETLFYKWEDLRDDTGHGIVKDVKTGKIYGNGCDIELRMSFIALSIFQVISSPFRLTYRVLSLCAFDFAVAGYRNAKVEWLNDKHKWQLSQQEEYLKSRTITQLPPTSAAFYWKVAKNIPRELIINIFKIVTYPLAVIALEFAALYGIFKPLDGRGLYSWIEDISAKRAPYDTTAFTVQGIFFFQLLNYSAPCLQSINTALNRECGAAWYAMRNYEEEYKSCKSLLLHIDNIFHEKKDFLELEGIKSADYQKILTDVRQYWTHISMKVTKKMEKAMETMKPIDETIRNAIGTIHDEKIIKKRIAIRSIVTEIISFLETLQTQRDMLIGEFERPRNTLENINSVALLLNATKEELKTSFDNLSKEIKNRVY